MFHAFSRGFCEDKEIDLHMLTSLQTRVKVHDPI